MLFSRIVASRPPDLAQRRKRVSEITATGIEALTVMPTLSTRYKDDAPKTIPSSVPRIKARGVNSGSVVSGETYGRKVGGVSGCLGWDDRIGMADLGHASSSCPMSSKETRIFAGQIQSPLPRKNLAIDTRVAN